MTKRFYLACLSFFFCIALYLLYNTNSIDQKNVNFAPDATLNYKNIPKSADNYAELVKEALNHSWTAYKEYAWGKDEILVLSKGSSTWMESALTLIDSLDTLKIAGFEEEFKLAKDYYVKNIKFSSDNDHTNLFETTIRILGGLITIYEFEKEPEVLEELKLLSEKLGHAFETPSGIPYSDINLRRGKGHSASWTSMCSLSEMSSVQLEFNEISRLTGNYNFTKISMETIEILLKQQEKKGQALLPIMVNCQTGSLDNFSPVSLGSRGDSFYEYLLKVWIQTGRTSGRLKKSYIDSINEIKNRLIRRSFPNQFLFVGELLSGNIFTPKMDHLVCFLPGTLAYGHLHGMPDEHLVLAKELMKSCYQLYNQTLTGLAPEIVFWNTNQSEDTKDFTIKYQDSFNKLRPETVESLFYLYRITKNSVYKDWAWKIFKAFNKYCRVEPFGYSGLRSVNELNSERLDKMESFWFAETLKYFLLIFDDEAYSKVTLDKWIFNTEAHPMKLTRQGSEINKWKRAMQTIFQ